MSRSLTYPDSELEGVVGEDRVGWDWDDGGISLHWGNPLTSIVVIYMFWWLLRSRVEVGAMMIVE
jgi:hypothetical protein